MKTDKHPTIAIIAQSLLASGIAIANTDGIKTTPEHIGDAVEVLGKQVLSVDPIARHPVICRFTPVRESGSCIEAEIYGLEHLAEAEQLAAQVAEKLHCRINTRLFSVTEKKESFQWEVDSIAANVEAMKS